jgi:hypothetical protein
MLSSATGTAPGLRQAQQHPGDEQLGDRHVRRDRVDDHDDRRRNQQAEGASTRQRAHRDRVRIAAFLQLRQRDLADRRAGGGAGARHRREDAAADHIGVQQAAGQAVQPRRQALEQIGRQARAEQDFTHPQEERQGSQRPARGRAPDREDHAVAHWSGGEDLHREQGDAQQGQADPEAGAEHCDEQRDQAGGNDDVHGL